MIATLMYHSIDATGSPISIGAEAFDGHVRWLASGAVRVLSLEQIAGTRADAGDAVAVTFDDAFATIAPGIERLLDCGVIPTVFVVTRHVGTTNSWGGQAQKGIPTLPLLGWDDLARLHERGASIQAHTRTHPRLTNLPASQVADELAGGREDLRAQLGIESHHIAYPYGLVDAAVATTARQFFTYGHTTDFSEARPNSDPLLLSRLDTYYFRTPDAFASWSEPSFRRRLRWIHARRAVRASLMR